jgi:hypothetical protein
MLWRVVELLRPPGWPAVPPALRPRLRALAVGAIATQVLFVASWLVAGALEPGYSHADDYVSELGAGSAAHPWIVDGGIGVWALGFFFVAGGLAIALRGRPWARVAPALFLLAGLIALLAAAFTLDCASTLDTACEAREDAGLLSWHHYAHQWASVVLPAPLVLTPFALARSEWPSLLARITLAGGVFGAILWLLSWGGQGETDGPVGAYQRLGFAAVHYWVIVIAITLLIEASGRFAPARPMQSV